MTWSLGLRGLN